MTRPLAPARWPRTLFGRVLLILFAALVAAQAITFVLVYAERGQTMRRMMVLYLSADVASSVAMLDRLPPADRASWLPRLQRANYRLSLDAGPMDALPRKTSASPLAAEIIEVVSRALSQPVLAVDGAAAGVALFMRLQLQDGSPVVVSVDEPPLRVSPWVVGALAVQLALLVAACAYAVRQATRPLARLADAAALLAPGQPAAPLPETGPREVAQASWAFNRMRERIDEHLDERLQMLAAISHDLQTPITRMRLRADLLADDSTRDKLQADLAQMQHLVEQGLVYARSAHAVQEPAVSTDLVALLESLVADYQDAAQPVHWQGGSPCTLATRPRALRRVIGNLVDNALKFGEAAEVSMVDDGGVVIRVMDRGPGIAPEELGKVMLPFYRIEGSRNAATGGTGLGLAIVQRLLEHCGGELTLAQREGGGLVASVRLA